MIINILFIGDIVGKTGMDMVQTWLPGLEKKYNVDLIIANGENSADGKGCTEKEGTQLFNLNVKVITGGNHTWDKHQSQEYLKKENRVLRPLNYPKGTYGNGFFIAETKKGKVGVLNLQGRAFMPQIDCPFRSAEWAIKRIQQDTKVIFVDFHAEATAEKIAMAHFLDGQVSAVIGTHPYDSVIGMKKEAAINRFLFQTPQKYVTATDENHLCGVFIKVNSDNGKAIHIERIILPEFEKSREA